MAAIATYATLFLGLTAAAAAQGRPSEAVYARLILALRPDSGQRIEVTKDSTPRLFPGTVFFRGRRATPPFGSGEDARPRVATVTVVGPDTIVVTTLGQLGSGWRMVLPQAPTSRSTAQDAVLGLLRLTGLVTRGELIGSKAEIRRKLPTKALAKPAAIAQVRNPSTIRTPDGFEVVFFASMPLGLFRYRVQVGVDKALSANRDLVSALKLQM